MFERLLSEYSAMSYLYCFHPILLIRMLFAVLSLSTINSSSKTEYGIYEPGLYFEVTSPAPASYAFDLYNNVSSSVI